MCKYRGMVSNFKSIESYEFQVIDFLPAIKTQSFQGDNRFTNLQKAMSGAMIAFQLKYIPDFQYEILFFLQFA